jgi:hypothetical protein
MSLVGSLEDLGLGEILQIISLSRKSGRLRLRSEDGKGWILFRDGEIRAAELEGGPTDLRELMVARGALGSEAAEQLARAAHASGASLAEVLAREGVASPERIAALRLEHVEASVLLMFQWATGEFSFEMGVAGERGGDADLVLATGMNPQFLALEGTRLQDERRSRGTSEPGVAPLLGADPGDDDEIWTGEPEPEETTHAVEPARLEAPRASSAPPRAAARARRTSAPGELPPVVVIEPELPDLERIKRGLADAVPRVHVFQRSDLAIARIRQYLARGETPIVILSARTPPDPLSGARDWREILVRLKSQAPRMPVFLLEPGDGAAERPPELDGVLPRPEPGAERELEVALRARVASLGAVPEPERALPEPAPRPAPQPALAGPANGAAAAPKPTLAERIHAAAARLRDPSSRGEVLPLVLRLAAETFPRVAVFMVRDGAALGMAQVGLPSAGGPDDSGIRRVALRADEPAWFRRVLETREPAGGPPSDEGDLRLAALLGGAPPSEAFVAPLATSSAVVALLYADTLPGDGPLPETAALESLLRAAGQALDRALRDRARQ